MTTTSSRSLIARLAPFFISRIRHNHRLLTSAPSSSSALPVQPQPEFTSPDNSVFMTDNCVRRMKELQAGESNKKMLRLSIEAGGCSGFQYDFSLDDKANTDDRIFEQDGVKLVVDNISFDFVKGATVDYVEELIRSAFQVIYSTFYSWLHWLGHDMVAVDKYSAKT
nr:iron-sulfur assembly protein IscA-like 2, mitochondrial [Ipomoea batatas]